jgi:hypothetical protein
MSEQSSLPLMNAGDLRRQLASLLQNDYSVEEFAELVKRRPFTVREWCRLGRLNARKSMTHAGPTTKWVIGRTELDRFRREGLLPRLTRR